MNNNLPAVSPFVAYMVMRFCWPTLYIRPQAENGRGSVVDSARPTTVHFRVGDERSMARIPENILPTDLSRIVGYRRGSDGGGTQTNLIHDAYRTERETFPRCCMR